MTQGYGPDHGQQGQWGQGDQSPQWGQDPQQAPEPQPQWGQPSPASSEPQWGQASPAAPSQPQWGQASPAAVPGGYPGAGQVPAQQQAPVGLITWLFRGAIGVVVLRGLYLLANIIVSVGVVGLAATATTGEGAMATAGIAMLLLLGALVLVDIASLALLVVSIIAMVRAQGRARTGAIIVGAAVVVSFLAYVVTRIIFLVVQNGAGMDVDALMVSAIVEYVIMGVHWLVFSVVVIIGARMSRRAVARSA